MLLAWGPKEGLQWRVEVERLAAEVAEEVMEAPSLLGGLASTISRLEDSPPIHYVHKTVNPESKKQVRPYNKELMKFHQSFLIL